MAEDSNHQVCPSCHSRPGTVCFNVEWHAANVSYDGGWTVEQLALRVRRLEEIVAKLRPAEETTPNLNCPTCGELYTGRGGQRGLPVMLSCPNRHEWPDPRGGCNS